MEILNKARLLNYKTRMNIKFTAFTFALIFLFAGKNFNAQTAIPTPSPAQQPPAAKAIIDVGEDRLVNAGGADAPLIEPHLAVNPKNPMHLVAGAIVAIKPDLSEMHCAIFTSFNGGRAWSRHDLKLKQCYDPWVAITGKGTAIFTAIDIDKEGSGLVIYRSADGGRNWTDQFISMGKGHDHQTIAVDNTNSKFSGSIYLISSIMVRNEAKQRRAKVFVARSSDDGLTFQEQSRVTPSNLNLQAANGVILSDGTLAIAYGDHHRWNAAPRLIRPREWLIVSGDAGKTFSEPLFITEIGGGKGWSFLDITNAGSSNPNRIFWLTAGDHKDKVTGIYIQSSDDQGERWTDPIRLDQGNKDNADAQIPSITKNKDGVVGVTWFDRRLDPARKCYDLFFAASLDGGKTFQPEVRVSSKSTCPDTPRNKGALERWSYGGDYNGLAADSNGIFHALWTDSRGEVFQLRTATVKVSALGARKE